MEKEKPMKPRIKIKHLKPQPTLTKNTYYNFFSWNIVIIYTNFKKKVNHQVSFFFKFEQNIQKML